MSRSSGMDRGVYSTRRDATSLAGGLCGLGDEWGPSTSMPGNTWSCRSRSLRGRDGIEVQARGAWLCTIRDGLVARICLYQEVQAARAAAGLRE
jgi:hypothetical protein